MVEVVFRDCACPGIPHPDGDVVYLPERIGYRGGIEAQVAVQQAAGDLVEATVAWMVIGVKQATGWNLVDERGNPVPFDVEVLLGDFQLGERIGDKASEIYTPQVLHPLANPRSTTSRPGPTVVSMSRAKRSTPSRPRRSSPGDSEASQRSTA